LLRAALAPAIAGAALGRLAALVALCGGGLAAFAVLALVLGIADWRALWGRLRRQPA
jgi:hypothetical protein